MFLFKTYVSETGFCLCLQAEPTQLGQLIELVPTPSSQTFRAYKQTVVFVSFICIHLVDMNGVL
jgi:hypothetical protein